ncbi:restriction endonuclease subunit S [Leeuwenhoekiella sp. LLG6367-2.1]|uniref:restriction endonuclease subunit S n=1 Tax=Leeuwenhoekiella sp. LLG6367-2.1 TaxID=3160833 RepID=UPI003870318A
MQLLKHFHKLSIHPKNAGELKGLILQLSIQGKLTADWRKQNPKLITGLNSAETLLKNIKTEKQRLISEKIIKKEKKLDPVPKHLITYKVPKNWVQTRLGEIGDWGAGATPLRSNSLFYDGSINWFKSGELNNGIIDFESKEKITEFALKKTSLRLNKPGDILIAMYGATIGKTAILAVKGTTNQAVCACTTFKGFSNTYLHLLLKGLKKDFINQGEGGAQPNISRVKIRNKIFALPPLEEQKEIVRVVEILFKEVQQLENLTQERIQLKQDYVSSALNQLATQNTQTAWQELTPHFSTFFDDVTNIKKLRETILQLAVQGKLTADWRNRHPELVSASHHASELLKSIQQEKAQLIKEKKIKKEKTLPPITPEEIPYELPEGWVWCRFQEIFDVRDGTHDSPKNVSDKNSYPLVTSKDFKKGFIDLENTKRISEKDYYKIIQRSLVEEDDILFSMIGGNLGNQVMVKGNTDFAIKNVALFKYYKKSLSVPDFLKIFSEHTAYEIQYKATGGAQPFVSLTFLRQMLFPLPSLEEQEAIVEKVNALMSLCDQLEEEVKTGKQQVEDLMKSVIREVFEEAKSV